MDSHRLRNLLLTTAAATGIVVGTFSIAGAATSDSSASTTTGSSSAAAPSNTSDRPDPATLANGPGETLLTGTDAQTVTAAALKAVPGATIIRVETDSGGATYEAHMKKADGTEVTVKFDKNFAVTETQDGFGTGGPGGDHQGPAPAATPGDAGTGA